MTVQKNTETEHADAVLLSANTGPDRVDLVESDDGTLSILLNHEELKGYRWSSARVEEGVLVYMRMIGDRPIE